MSEEKFRPSFVVSSNEDDVLVAYNITDKRHLSGSQRDSSESSGLSVRLTEREDKEEAEWQALFASSEEMLIEMANRAEEEYHAGLTWPIDRETT